MTATYSEMLASADYLERLEAMCADERGTPLSEADRDAIELILRRRAELAAALARARAECEEQARLNGAGASREAALLAKLEQAERERDDYKAHFEACDRQRIEILQSWLTDRQKNERERDEARYKALTEAADICCCMSN